MQMHAAGSRGEPSDIFSSARGAWETSSFRLRKSRVELCCVDVEENDNRQSASENQLK